MKSEKSIILFVTACSLFIGSSPLASQELTTSANKPDLAMRLSLETNYDSNATRLRSDNPSPNVEERQYRLFADVSATVDRDIVFFSADYNFSKFYFDKNSQDDTVTRVGNSELNLGADENVFDLSMTHDSRIIVADPLDPLIIDNTRRQETATIIPRIKTRQDKLVVASLSGLFNDVKFENEDTDDSETFGGQLELSWNFNRLRQISFVGTVRDTEFDFDTTNDYQLMSYALRLNTELRYLTYAVELGANSIEPDDGEKQSDFYYDIEADYSHSGFDVRLSSSRFYTDSTNNAGITLEGAQITTGGATAGLIDQLLVTTHEVSLSMNNICRLCTLSLNYLYQKSEFENLIEEDAANSALAVQFRYMYSDRLTSLASYSLQDINFRDNALQQDSETHTYLLSFSYLLSKRTQISTNFRRVQREENINPYDSSLVGVVFTLQL